MDIEERFLQKVLMPENPDECWEWQGNEHRQGYGFFKVGGRAGKNMLAHRVSYIHFHEAILTPDIKLRHKCDNPSCVHPLHVVEGTQGDNVRDMAQKGRHRGTSKLTDDQVRAIRADPRQQMIIETEMGLASGTVSRIKSGSRYGRVSDQGQVGVTIPKV